jgi:hypothetical protein
MFTCNVPWRWCCFRAWHGAPRILLRLHRCHLLPSRHHKHRARIARNDAVHFAAVCCCCVRVPAPAKRAKIESA